MPDKQSEASPAGQQEASKDDELMPFGKTKGSWPKITLFGDSITQLSWDPDNGAWASHIAHKVSTYFDVDVRGFYGYNTNWARNLMPRQFPESYLKQVEVFVMFFGHNDSWERKQPVSLTIQKFEENIRAIVDYLERHGLDTKQKMILVTPSWYDSTTANQDQSKPPSEFLIKDREHSAQYAETTIQVARDLGIACLDFWAQTVDHPELASLFTDGVHFSPRGARLYFDNLWPLIEAKIVQRFGAKPDELFHEVYYDQHPEFLAHYRGTRQLGADLADINEAQAATPPEPVSSGSASGSSKVRDRAKRESGEAEPSCSPREKHQSVQPPPAHQQPHLQHLLLQHPFHQQQHQHQEQQQQPPQLRVESTVEAADSPTKPSPGKKTRTEQPDNPDEPSSSKSTRSTHKR